MSDLFDGLGTELVVLIITALVGVGGYKFVSKRCMSQKAGKNSVQIQSGRDTHIEDK